MSENTLVLCLSCMDRPGIVAAVTTELAELGANIAESNQFWDRQTGQFFMRIAFTSPADAGRDAVERALRPAIARFEMKTTIADLSRKPRIVIMVSKFDHAMLHLLYQIRVGWLGAEVAAIVSNHDDSRGIAEYENIAFHHLPVGRDNKTEQEEKLLQIVQETGADLVVLARYMQILSNRMSTRLFGKVINIHHSFLPSFKGAKPYHQAHARGVKLIGATAHYVTPDLDEGPIIGQETEPVTHAMSADDLVAVGRDIESRVLAKAVKYHVESRVMLNGSKTVVFA
ncbi:formyltetrahydrofolate deformylase [Roseibium salinum]|uniref:Formyltetrahydrofolate deformylase n=1 Tax=Roseibium salinum TaxID=1604349 RepID=A0ABT3QWA3_9HYPH|nr:formyltetrahydrofolate deformylase [Roseibium sp. DSM 29163]MCX2721192.1 formyltetrahydrofolate deformylase [Roseibium sp. DSM 29163]MDN3722673.1 formyltetrahydrofolate deformylase [Roseibium salinum]